MLKQKMKNNRVVWIIEPYLPFSTEFLYHFILINIQLYIQGLSFLSNLLKSISFYKYKLYYLCSHLYATKKHLFTKTKL